MIDMSGKTFGMVTVIRLVPSGSIHGERIWMCRCQCGTTFRSAGYCLRIGRRKSCGCATGKNRGESNVTHGAMRGNRPTSEYGSWAKMIARCENPSDKAWSRYGGRGIRVCQQWRDSFEAFLADMGIKPSADHSIDRYPNNNGDYEPGNCRWATPREQAQNTRTNRVLEWRGESKCAAEWARIVGIDEKALYSRLRSGWTVEDALSTPRLRNQYDRIGARATAARECGA